MEIDHKQLGIEYFNKTWELIDKKTWTWEEQSQMIGMAHASRFHWGFVGNEMNFARGEWQISRVYALLGLGESSLWHAERCLRHTKQANLAGFDLAFGLECVARAHSVCGNAEKAAAFKQEALAACEGITEKEDKDYVLAELATIA